MVRACDRPWAEGMQSLENQQEHPLISGHIDRFRQVMFDVCESKGGWMREDVRLRMQDGASAELITDGKGKKSAVRTVRMSGEGGLESVSKKPPVVFLSGFGSDTALMAETKAAVAEKGRNVMSLHLGHGHKPTKEFLDSIPTDLQYIRKLPQVQQIFTLITLLDQMEDTSEKVEVVAHSQGAFIASHAAAIRPDLFQKLNLVTPPGMVGKMSGWELFQRSRAEGREQQAIAKERVHGEQAEWYERWSKHAWEVFSGYLKEGGRIRSLKQMKALANVEMHDVLKRVSDNHNIPVHIIAGQRDKMFPAHDMKQYAEAAGASFEVIEGVSHNPFSQDKKATNEALIRTLSEGHEESSAEPRTLYDVLMERGDHREDTSVYTPDTSMSSTESFSPSAAKRKSLFFDEPSKSAPESDEFVTGYLHRSSGGKQRDAESSSEKQSTFSWADKSSSTASDSGSFFSKPKQASPAPSRRKSSFFNRSETRRAA